jgi:hypothetical protein
MMRSNDQMTPEGQREGAACLTLNQDRAAISMSACIMRWSYYYQVSDAQRNADSVNWTTIMPTAGWHGGNT